MKISKNIFMGLTGSKGLGNTTLVRPSRCVLGNSPRKMLPGCTTGVDVTNFAGVEVVEDSIEDESQANAFYSQRAKTIGSVPGVVSRRELRSLSLNKSLGLDVAHLSNPNVCLQPSSADKGFDERALWEDGVNRVSSESIHVSEGGRKPLTFNQPCVSVSVSSGISVSDNDIRRCNLKILNESVRGTAGKISDICKDLGLTSQGGDEEMIRLVDDLETRDKVAMAMLQHLLICDAVI